MDAPGASYPRAFPVTDVGLAGASLRIAVPAADGAFAPAAPGVPRRAEVERADGSRVEVPYVSADPLPAGAGGGAPGSAAAVTLELVAAPGAAFPPDAVEAAPAAEFMVAGVSEDGAQMVVAAPDTGIFPQCAGGVGSCGVKLKFADGVEVEQRLAAVEPDGAGLRLTAARNTTFPPDAIAAGPAAAGAAPPGGREGALPALAVRDASAAPAQLVVAVASAKDVPPGPGTVTVIDLDGAAHKDVPYETAALLPPHASGEKAVLLTAPPGGTFPDLPTKVIPDAPAAAPRERAAQEGEAVWFPVEAALPGTLQVAAPAAAFPPPPGEVLVGRPGLAPVTVPYSAVQAADAVAGAARVLLVAAEGAAFPAGAASASPALRPVISVREDGAAMQVLAADDGTFAPGPAKLLVQVADGSDVVAHYDRAAALPASAAAGGMLLTAAPGTFPPDAAFVKPTGPGVFSVAAVAADHKALRVSAPDDGTFAPGPAAVALLFEEGGEDAKVAAVQIDVPYSRMDSVPAAGDMPPGLVLHGDFADKGVGAVTGVVPLGAAAASTKLIGDVDCAGSPVRNTGLLAPHAPLYSDASEPAIRALPPALSGLEYLRTPADAPAADSPAAACDVHLRAAADVFVLLPAKEFAPKPLPVAAVADGGESLTVVLPPGAPVPGPLVPAGPWALTAHSPETGEDVPVTYAKAEVVEPEGDEEDKGAEDGGAAPSAEGVLVRLTAAEGETFPADAASVAVAPGTAPPAWVSEGFVLIGETVETDAGPMQVFQSKAPVLGTARLGSPAAAPARVKDALRGAVGGAGEEPAALPVGRLVPGARLYTDADAEFLALPAALSGQPFVRAAEKDAAAAAADFMTLELAAPSDVYVLTAAEEDAAPKWLASGFEKTELSVDTTLGHLDVWRSKEPVDGAAVLGGNEGAAPAMYVATAVARQRPASAAPGNLVVAVRPAPQAARVGDAPLFGAGAGGAGAAGGTAAGAEESEYPAPSALAVFPVAHVSEDKKTLVVQAAPDAPFAAAPGKLELTTAGGARLDAAYTAMAPMPALECKVAEVAADGKSATLVPAAGAEAHPPAALKAGGSAVVSLPEGEKVLVPFARLDEAPEGDGKLVMHAAPGRTIPPGAEAVEVASGGLAFTAAGKFPADARTAAPAPEFSVVGLSPDKTRMRVAVPDDGSFLQGPAEMRVRLANKEEVALPYSMAVPVRATSSEPAGLVFVARPGEEFPPSAMLAAPAVASAAQVVDLVVSSEAGPTYTVEALGVGKKVHSDSPEVFVRVPDVLLGEVIVATAQADAGARSPVAAGGGGAGASPGGGDFMSLRLSQPAFVGLLVPAPEKRDSWEPFWLPSVLGEDPRAAAEALPLWVTEGFRPTGLAVLSNATSYEVLLSKEKLHGTVVLGGNADAPSAGDRGMFDVLVTPRDLTLQPPFARRPAAGAPPGPLARESVAATAAGPWEPSPSTPLSERWRGPLSDNPATQAWFPVTSIEAHKLTVAAPPGSFPPGRGTFDIVGSDGTRATYPFRTAIALPADTPEAVPQIAITTDKSDRPPYALVPFPGSAAFARPLPAAPLQEWEISEVQAGGKSVTVQAPAEAFPEAPAWLSVVVPDADHQFAVPYAKVSPLPSGTAVVIDAGEDEAFPAGATFVGVKPMPQTTTMRNIQAAGPLMNDLCTAGVGKRLYVDSPALTTAVPLPLVGANVVLTADRDAELQHEPPTDRVPDPVSCALRFSLSKAAPVYVAQRTPGVPACSEVAGDCDSAELTGAVPRWLAKGFAPWVDPATGKQGEVRAADSAGGEFSLLLWESREPVQDVCLGGASALDARAPAEHNYVALVPPIPLNEFGLPPPVHWTGKELALEQGTSKWFTVVARSEDGKTVRVQARALQDGFLMGEGQDEPGAVVVRSVQGEATYAVAAMLPVPADETAPAGIELSAAGDAVFPATAAAARPAVAGRDNAGALEPAGAVDKGGKGAAPADPHGTVSLVEASVHVAARRASAVLAVQRAGGARGAVSVRFYTSDGTARAGADYTAKTGTLVWGDGDAKPKEIEVALPADRAGGSPLAAGGWTRFFTVSLSAPTGGARLGTQTHAAVEVDVAPPAAPPSDKGGKGAAPAAPAAPRAPAALPGARPEPWEFPVLGLTEGGAALLVAAPRDAPLARADAPSAVELRFADPARAPTVVAVARAAPAPAPEFPVAAVSASGYVMVLAPPVGGAAVPPGPGVLEITAKGAAPGAAPERFAYSAAAPIPGDAAAGGAGAGRVAVHAPAGFPFPQEAARAAPAGGAVRLEAPPGVVFPRQAAAVACTVGPAPPAALAASQGYAITQLLDGGALMRVEAPPSAPFPPKGKLHVLLPAGGGDALPYASVAVAPPLEYKVVLREDTGASLEVFVRDAPFPAGPGQLLVQGAAGGEWLVEYASAEAARDCGEGGEGGAEAGAECTPRTDVVTVTAAAGDSFPSDAKTVTLASPALLLAAPAGQPFPADLGEAIGSPVATAKAAPPAAAALAAAARSEALLVDEQGARGAPAALLVTAVGPGGANLTLAAPASAPLAPAGVLEVQDAAGRVTALAYDSVAPAAPLRVAVLAADPSARTLTVALPAGAALPPAGELRAAGAGAVPLSFSYTAVHPVPGAPRRAVVALGAAAPGSALPAPGATLVLHPAGLVVRAPASAPFPEALAPAGAAAAPSEAWPAGKGPPRFAVTAASADGRVLRVAAPPDFRAWEGAAQWGVQLALHSGETLTLPFAKVAPAPAGVVRFESVSHDGAFARVELGGDALPPAPASLTVARRGGGTVTVPYRAASATAVAPAARGGAVLELVAAPGARFPLDAVSATLPGALEFTAHPAAPFPPSLRPAGVATTFAAPAAPALDRMAVAAAALDGSSLSLLVPAGVFPFPAGGAGGEALLLLPGDAPRRVTYASAAPSKKVEFAVAHVAPGGASAALRAVPGEALAPAPGVVTCVGVGGARTRVPYAAAEAVEQAGADGGALVRLTAAPGAAFPADAARAESDPTLTLFAHARAPFPRALAERALATAFVAPVPAAGLGQGSLQALLDLPPAPAAGAGAGPAEPAAAAAARPGGPYPFTFEALAVSLKGSAVSIFVPPGALLPPAARFDYACRDGARGELRAGARGAGAGAAAAEVLSASADGAEMTVALSSPALFPAGPGLLDVVLADGSRAVVPFDAAAPLLEPVEEVPAEGAEGAPAPPAGRKATLVAPPGLPFPQGARAVTPRGQTLSLAAAAGESFPQSLRGCALRPLPAAAASSAVAKKGADAKAAAEAREAEEEEAAEEAAAAGEAADEKKEDDKVKDKEDQGAAAEGAAEGADGHDPRREAHGVEGFPYLKQRPGVANLAVADSVFEYAVGTLGKGKRAFVDSSATFAVLPPELLGASFVMTAQADGRGAPAGGALLSLEVDERVEVYILAPPAPVKSAAAAALAWLPFRLPAMLAGEGSEDQDLPAWMADYQRVPDVGAQLSSGALLRVFRRPGTATGALQFGAWPRDPVPPGAAPGMYLPVLQVPAGPPAADA